MFCALLAGCRFGAALVNIQKGKAVAPLMWNSYSTKSNVKDVKEADIQKSVFISQSNDIFTNLAMEDWIYRNYDLTNHHIMMLWLNDPCVVIGRHQNPWKEADVSAAEARDIKIARRNSGGGTVYHDKGNLNMTFFIPRERYNRKYNLNIITRALFREWGIRSQISPREDIVLEGNLKVSALCPCSSLVN